MAEFVAVIGFMVGVMLNAKRLTTMPFYLWGICMSYILIMCAAIAEMIVRLGSDLSWRTPLFLIAATLSLATCIYQRTVWRKYENCSKE